MKKIFYLVCVTFLLLQSCSPESSSNTNNTTGNVDYEYTITFDGITYKVQGNTAKDAYNGPITNYCFAQQYQLAGLNFSIKDVNYYSFVSGAPLFTLFLQSTSNFTLGTNLMNFGIVVNGVSNSYYKTPGICPSCSYGSVVENRLPINITDLGTPLKGTIGTSSVIFGNTIKGNYSGVVYSVGPGSIYTNVPHNLSINFKAVWMTK